MVKTFQYKYRFTIALLIIIIFLGLFWNIPNSTAQGEKFSVELPNQYPILEYTDKFGQNINTKTVNISLPTEQWNITDIELNFTDIKLYQELKVIEDDINTYRVIDKGTATGHRAYAVQINITETTRIFQIHIYGQLIGNPPPVTITVQIKGYDNSTNKPNNVIYASTVLNMSNSLMWHIQNFSSLVRLNKGQYYLIFNGTDIPSGYNDKYHWYYDDIGLNNTNLYTWDYDAPSQWHNPNIGKPFLYKLVQRVNRSYNPEDINMTINVNDLDYPILNGTKLGRGTVNITDNFHPNSDFLGLMVQNSQSLDLYYNISYYAKYKNSFLSNGTTIIEEGSNNIWQVNPQINRAFNNYSIEFIYSRSWFNLSVFGEGENKTSEIILSENSLKILNTSIHLPSSTWLITANSPNIGFELHFPITSWKIGQELEFSLQEPVIPGTYTFKLYNNMLGDRNYSVTIVIPTDDNLFSYDIPSDVVEGTYTAFVLFNNGTDAGIASQEFEIIAGPSGPPESPIILIVSLIIIISVAVGISSYVAYKKYRASYRHKMKNILNQCLDVMNLEYIIVLHSKSGIDVFSLSFGEKEVDSTLISGFLHALQNFGTEILEGVRESRTLKVDYKKYVILMTEFVNLRLIVIMKENPSKNFLYSIESLAYDIYKEYGKLLDDFHGNLKDFRGIKELVEKNLNLAIIYPLTIVKSEKVKLTAAEKEMVARAKTFMELHNFNYFYAIYLMPENIFTPKDAKAILNLIDKKVFRPLENTLDK